MAVGTCDKHDPAGHASTGVRTKHGCTSGLRLRLHGYVQSPTHLSRLIKSNRSSPGITCTYLKILRLFLLGAIAYAGDPVSELHRLELRSGVWEAVKAAGTPPTGRYKQEMVVYDDRLEHTSFAKSNYMRNFDSVKLQMCKPNIGC